MVCEVKNYSNGGIDCLVESDVSKPLLPNSATGYDPGILVWYSIRHGKSLCINIYTPLGEERRLRVFENKMLRKIFGPKREEDVSWRKLHNHELHSLYSSPNIVRVIKSRRMRWAGHVARMGEGRDVYRFWLGGPKPRDHWEDLSVGGKMTLRWTLER
jgi:hypothetical protein